MPRLSQERPISGQQGLGDPLLEQSVEPNSSHSSLNRKKIQNTNEAVKSSTKDETDLRDSIETIEEVFPAESLSNEDLYMRYFDRSEYGYLLRQVVNVTAPARLSKHSDV